MSNFPELLADRTPESLFEGGFRPNEDLMTKIVFLGHTRVGTGYGKENMRLSCFLKLCLTEVSTPSKAYKGYMRCVGLFCDGRVFYGDHREFVSASPLHVAEYMAQNADMCDERHQDIAEIVSIWKRWDGNAFRAGTPEQERFLAAHSKYQEHQDDYPLAVSLLKNAGLYSGQEHPFLPGTPYEYGKDFLVEVLPAGVLKRVYELSDDGARYPALRKILLS